MHCVAEHDNIHFIFLNLVVSVYGNNLFVELKVKTSDYIRILQ